MVGKQLSELCTKLPVIQIHGDQDPLVASLAYDSRQVEMGFAFFALPGIHVDGHNYITAAIERGAVAIFCEQVPRDSDDLTHSVVFIQVHDSRRTMSTVAARFYDNPSHELSVIGVTGTDGKSTTTWLIDQLLSAQEQDVGSISTVMIRSGAQAEKNFFRQSTPEAPEIQGYLRQMIDNGRTFAVVEATSHGLSTRTARLQDVEFDAAVFTNITHEHLEFHGSFEQYRSDKAHLFRALDRSAMRQVDCQCPIFGVVNLNDRNSYYFRQATQQTVLTYSIGNHEADLYADRIDASLTGTHCQFHWRDEIREVFIPLPGIFNVENVLAAVLTTAYILQQNPLDLLEAVPSLKSLPGRMHIVTRDLPWTPIVDYAHTPGAFTSLLPFIRKFTPNRVIAVFGSAGERDIDKRAMQGKIAGVETDIVVLTDEDPRGEESMKILTDIAAGVQEAAPDKRLDHDIFLIPDRREAIRKAISLAESGDAVLFLGKGHEGSIVYADHVQDWDEAAVVQEEISR